MKPKNNFAQTLHTCVKASIANKEVEGVTGAAALVGLTSNGLHNIMQGNRKPSRPVYDLLVSKWPAVKDLIDPSTLRTTSRHTKAAGPAKNQKLTVKRVKRVATANYVSSSNKTKAKVAPVRRVSMNLVASVIALHKDRKALFNIQGLLVTAVADGVSLEELQELLGNAA